jgi:hypothetical protein
MNDMLQWMNSHQTLLWWLGMLSILTFIGSLIAIPYLVSWIPQDYFCRDRGNDHSFRKRHPIIRLIGLVLKNIFGVLFVLAGIAMLVLPGQGILTMLIGLMLMNFPGKLTLERRLIQQPAVFKTINWIRAKRGRPGLQKPQ